MLYKLILLAILALTAGLFIASHFSGAPDILGTTGGRLSPCPDSPNCVSSQATDSVHTILPLKISGKTDTVMNQLSASIEKMGGKIITQDGPYLHAEFRSRFFRFVDDLECLYDEQRGLIEIRSAARLGYSDFSVNRKRIVKLRELISQQ